VLQRRKTFPKHAASYQSKQELQNYLVGSTPVPPSGTVQATFCSLSGSAGVLALHGILQIVQLTCCRPPTAPDLHPTAQQHQHQLTTGRHQHHNFHLTGKLYAAACCGDGLSCVAGVATAPAQLLQVTPAVLQEFTTHRLVLGDLLLNV
jgi:hypothetical protein